MTIYRSTLLTERYGREWSRQNLERMVRFAAWFPDCGICSTLSSKLSRSHFAEIISIA